MWQLILAAPLIVIVGLALVPVLLLYAVVLWIQGLALRTRAAVTWPRGTIALVAYTRSAAWAPYIEEQLLPAIGHACIVIDRSNAQWKQRYPLERRLIDHFGGWRENNPIAIVFPPRARTKVFRMYPGFREAQKGRSKELETTVSLLRETILASRSEGT